MKIAEATAAGSGTMNELCTLCQVLKRELPEAAVLKLDLPVQSDRGGWLDIEYGGKWVVVEWRPGIGFGVSLAEGLEEDPAKGLFEGPDEVLENLEEAQERILSLLLDRGVPPEGEGPFHSPLHPG